MKQNDVSEMRTLGQDLNSRWEYILKNIIDETDFQPDWDKIRKSQWWKTGKIGAVSINGKFKKKDAVLKIQGTKPNINEAEQIKKFEKQNKSNLIRATKVYKQIDWNEDDQFEANIFESIKGSEIILDRPINKKELDRFFEIYEEYKKNCINKAWLNKPKNWNYADQFKRWQMAVENMQADDVYAKKEDMNLAMQGIEIIEKNLSVDDFEFMHGHVAIGDFREISQTEVVIFSNLFWGWRIPFYDAVFAYHWWMLGMHHSKELTMELQESQRKIWLDKIFSLDVVKNRKNGEKLINLALLERAIPALMVDRFMINLEDGHTSSIVIEGARNELKRLINLFN